LDEDLAALQRMPDRLRIEKYNDLKSDEEELLWEFKRECPDFLTDAERDRLRGELRLARLLLAASFYVDGDVPAAMGGDFIEAELQAVADFDRYKQFDALDQSQIEERIRRMEGEVYELVTEYTSTQIANMDDLIDNPDVQQDVIERLVERYDDRRERVRQGFFIYVETHGMEYMVESIEEAIEAVADSTDERERVREVLQDELTSLESSLESGFEKQRQQMETELTRVEQRLASETVDTDEIRTVLDSIETVDDETLSDLTDAISRTQALESDLERKINDLEEARKQALNAEREQAGQETAEIVEAELERLTDQRGELKNEVDRLQAEREEIEHARNRLSERQQTLEERVEEVETSVDTGSGIEGTNAVTSSTARLFEMDYVGRFDTTMYDIESIRLPDESFDVPDGYWDGRSQRRNDASRMTNLLQEHDNGPLQNHPTNPTARYELTESKYLGLSSRTAMIIEATVSSHLEAHAINGFDTVPADLDDLLGYVNSAVQEASDEDVPYLLGIASPTGWTDRVKEHVLEDELSRTRFSRHVSVCLVDLRNGGLIYDRSDPVVTENIGLFERAVQTEAVDECVSMIRAEYVADLGRETVMLEEIVDETDYGRHIVKRAFDRLESSGEGEQFYVDEHGLALDIGK
jgi:prefoldin subunit 5